MGPPTRGWGWHELDPFWARRLVADADLPSGALVLDVGAGGGAITAALLERDLRVIAFELHPGRAAALRVRFGESVRIVRADASDLRLPKRSFHVVANPPFAITSALLRRILGSGSRLVTARVVVQHQAARRWSTDAAPRSARRAGPFAIEAGPKVPRRAFRPPPHVDCRILRIDRR